VRCRCRSVSRKIAPPYRSGGPNDAKVSTHHIFIEAFTNFDIPPRIDLYFRFQEAICDRVPMICNRHEQLDVRQQLGVVGSAKSYSLFANAEYCAVSINICLRLMQCFADFGVSLGPALRCAALH